LVIDTSALVAILLNEAEASRLVEAIASAQARLVATPTVVEASAVMRAKKGPGGEVALDALLRSLDAESLPFSNDAARLARLCYNRFGKGVGSPGVLNYGDCLAYGAAMAAAQPLLFKGDDFGRTDVMVAAY